jgi:chromosome segregation ATPase
MGWVSMTEDAIERISSGINQLKKYNLETVSPRVLQKHKQDIYDLIKTCESHMRDIRSHLDIATDPKLDLVDENKRLKARIKELEKELEREKKEMEKLQQEHASLQERHSALHKDFNEVNGKSARRFAEIKELEKKYGKLEKEHLRLERSKRR